MSVLNFLHQLTTQSLPLSTQRMLRGTDPPYVASAEELSLDRAEYHFRGQAFDIGLQTLMSPCNTSPFIVGVVIAG